MRGNVPGMFEFYKSENKGGRHMIAVNDIVCHNCNGLQKKVCSST